MKGAWAVGLALVLAGCAHTGARYEAKPADLDPDIAAITNYEFGESRERLTVVEDRVKAATTPEGRAELARQLSRVLDMHATLQAKQFCCRQLALIGTAENVPAIADLLYNPDTADMARYALQPIPDPAVDEALLTALPHVKDSTKVGIINTLGARRTAAAKPELERLQQSGAPAVAEAASAALAKISG